MEFIRDARRRSYATGKKDVRARGEGEGEARNRSRLEINKDVEDKPPLHTSVNAFVPERIFVAIHFHTQQRVM